MPPPPPPPTRSARALARFRRHIDVRFALVGALFMGGLVFAVNVSDSWVGATTAALKQGFYTFFIAGFVMKTAERLGREVRPGWLGVLLGTLVPSAIAIGLTFALHSLKGTPEPLLSTLPTALTGPPSFFWWARRQYRASRGDAPPPGDQP